MSCPSYTLYDPIYYPLLTYIPPPDHTFNYYWVLRRVVPTAEDDVNSGKGYLQLSLILLPFTPY